MNKVGGYSAYQAGYYESKVQSKKDKEKTQSTDKNNQAESVKKESVQLSDRAKELLKELQKKYSNMDFMVANFNSDEEAQKYLSRGTKEYSVLIAPEELEKMAEDADYKQKNLAILEESTGKLKEMAEQLGDRKDEVVNLGVSINKDGTVSYFAELQKMSDRQKEHIEKKKAESKEEKAEKVKEEQAAKEKERLDHSSRKRIRLQADSTEELLDKIHQINWEEVEVSKPQYAGSRIDFTV